MAPPFIPYYIDYNVKNQSKTIGVSKKKVTFKFGFANRKAVDEGLVGAHCRGSEHECVFTWSLNSGKRHVTMDGKDVHFSSSGQNGWTSDRTWQHVFSLKVPNYTGTFRCHLISQPAPQGSNIRPFDLRVGGVSIFKFNQIFQLGTAQMVVRKPGGSRATYTGSGDDEPMSAEERRMLAAARVASMQEFRKEQDRNSAAAIVASAQVVAQQQPNGTSGPAPPAAAAAAAAAAARAPAPASGDADLLMSFDGPPMPAPQAPGHAVSSLTLGSDFGSSNNSFPPAPPGQAPYGYPAPPPQHPGYGQPPPQQQQQQQQQIGYGQAPAPPQQQQNPFGASFASAPALPVSTTSSFGGGSATTAPTANTTAMTPYQGQTQSTPGYSLGPASSFASLSLGTAPTAASTQAPAPTPTLANSMDPFAAKPPADPWASPAAAAAPSPQQQQQSYGQLVPHQQQQQQPAYGGYATQSQSSFPAMQSPSAQTQGSSMTYGSAPDFARPPQQQPQQQQYQQPQQQQAGFGQAPAAHYGAAPPAYGAAPPAVTAGNPYAPPAQYQQHQSFTGF